METIQTYDGLLEYALSCLDRTKAIEPVEIAENLNFKIKIKGHSWDGSIDYRIARYIIDIQEAVNKLLIGYIDKENLSSIKNEFIVKFKVEKGCSFVEVKISDTIKAFIKNMTGRQKLALGIVIILTIGGYFTLSKLLDYKKDIATKAMDESTKIEIVKVLDKAIEKIDIAEKPARGLVNKIEPGDTIQLLPINQELTHEDAKKVYPRKQRLQIKTAYIDDEYIIKDIAFDENVIIVIEKGAYTIRCNAALNEAEIEKLYSQVKEKHNSGEIPFTLPLKITAKYTEREIKEAIIFGIGEKREQAENIADLIKSN